MNIRIRALIVGLCALIFACFYWARTVSIINIQVKASKRDDYNDEIVAYDVGCGDPFSDIETAMEILIDDLSDCDSECRDAGSRWSHAFIANSLITLIITLNMICVAIGGSVPLCRCFAAFCAFCVCFAHVPIIVMTAVYRFGPFGRLCALSKRPTFMASSDDAFSTDEWTYSMDGSLLLALWIL